MTTCADRTSEYGAADILFAPEFKASPSVMLNVLTINPRQILSPRSVRKSVRRIRVKTRTNSCRPQDLKIILLILSLSGDIEMNPGPVAYPYTVCSNAVKKNQRAILCSTCDIWTHTRCCGVSTSKYQILSDHVENPWLCPGCLMAELPLLDDDSVLNISTLEMPDPLPEPDKSPLETSSATPLF